MDAKLTIDLEVEEFEVDVIDPGPIASVRIPSLEGQPSMVEVVLWDNRLLVDAEDGRAGDWNDDDARFVATLDGEGSEFTAEECRQWAAALLRAADMLEEAETEAEA